MNDKLLLQDLVVLLAKKSGITQKDADKFFRELFQLILERIYENDIVKIKDLGTFKLVEISSRESVDVNTGEKIEIPAHFKMTFTPDRSLKELVNEPFAHFESVVLEDNENGSEEQEYSINNFAGTIADNFKPVVNSFPDIDDELLLDDDDDDLLETDTDDFEDESDDLFQEQLFVPDTPVEQDTPSAAPISETQTEEGKTTDTKTTDTNKRTGHIDLVVPENRPRINIQEEKKTERKAPPLLDLIDIRRERPKTTGIVPEKKEEVHDEILLSETDIDINITPSPAEKIPAAPPVEKKEETKAADPKDTIASDTPKQSKANQESKEEQPTPIQRYDDDDNQDAIEYNYIDYEKIEKDSRKRKRIPLIIVIIAILAFAVYQFVKLFDVTYDYEYYINHVPPLTLSDSMRMVDEVVAPKPLYNAETDTASNVAGKPISPSVPATSPFTGEHTESNLDELDRQLHSQHQVERKGIHISEHLQIRITNKAQIYLSEK